MKVGRNDPCPCGSGKKYKYCCYAKDSVKHEEAVAVASEPSGEESAEASHSAEQHGRSEHHRKDRSRFQGEVRGGSATFRPRVNRGAQRGT